MRRFITRFLNDTGGATALEYGLILALIVVVLLSALSAMSGGMTAAMNTLRAALGG